MLFCTPPFWAFFFVVFAAYWAMPWHRGRVLLLLAASIWFYASWNSRLAILLCVSTLGDYLIARGMEATSSPRLRKSLLLISLTANLGILCYFKYANFFLASLAEAGRAWGVTLSLPVLQVVMVVGISFYTFEAINYTVDVYRRKIRAARDLTHFMLFILFFPHLVAGPIVRASDFLPSGRAPQALELAPRLFGRPPYSPGRGQKDRHRRSHGPVRRSGLCGDPRLMAP